MGAAREWWNGSRFESVVPSAEQYESWVRAGNALKKGYCESKEEVLKKNFNEWPAPGLDDTRLS